MYLPFLRGKLYELKAIKEYIEDWYGNTISNFADTDLVLYDSYDNYIPYDAGEKIIKKLPLFNSIQLGYFNSMEFS